MHKKITLTLKEFIRRLYKDRDSFMFNCSASCYRSVDSEENKREKQEAKAPDEI